MDRGNYIAAAGGMLQFRKLEIVNNNLANANTPGFKGQFLVNRSRSFDETLASTLLGPNTQAMADHSRSQSPITVGTATDFSMGSIKATGNPLDVSLRNPKDFFVVETDGGTTYTRAGNFTLNGEGELITQDGMRVQGDSGTIVVSGGSANITPSGDVMSDGQIAARLRVVRFDDVSGLERTNASRFKAGNAKSMEDVEADVVPQSLEMSNVSAIQSMMDLIAANRAFQMYTKTASTIGEIDATAINKVGKRF